VDLQVIKSKYFIESDSPIAIGNVEEIKWLIQSFEDQQREIEQYQLQEELLLGRLQKLTLEYREMKEKNRLKFVEKMLIENTELAQELALIKGEMSG
jgi:hypothetical protein